MARPKPNLLNTLRKEIPNEARLLLAVSGGVDSVVLLHACASIAGEKRLLLEVAHLDHGLRQESVADAAFVAQLCQNFGLQCHLSRAEKRDPQENVEAWGRQQRYSFFAHVLSERSLDFVITAHHANDVAETMLMRLLSNKDIGTILRIDHQRQLLRPMLGLTREEIQRYAAENSLEWREDESNSDEGYLRNRVRVSLIPLLEEKFDPRILETLSNRAQALSEDSQSLEAWAVSEAARLNELSFGSKDWLQALRAILNALEPAIQWRLVSRLLLPKLEFPLGRSHSKAVVEFLLSEQQGIELPTGTSLRRRAGGIELSR